MNDLNNEPVKNLILGIIDNYNYYDVSLFLNSLEQVQYKGHLCLFVGPGISYSTLNKFKKHNVEIILYKSKFPFISDPHANNFKILPEPIHLYNFRHYLYYNYLLKNDFNFKNVLITDVKDVIFQKDPFDFIIEDKIYVAVENVAVTIGFNPWTAKWIKKGYGTKMLSTLEGKEVICAGTTLAPVQLMMTYLKKLIGEFYKVKDAYKCADQAMHNVLIHTNQLEVQRCYNFNGPFLTLDTEVRYQVDKNKFLVNDSGEIINIIHQYDRHPKLLKLFISKYRVSTFWILTFPFLKSKTKKIKQKINNFSKLLRLKIVL